MSHLGGHLDMTHVDRGALEFLQSLGCNSFLDVGCSVGGQVAEAKALGMDAMGIDGDLSLVEKNLMLSKDVMFVDFTKGNIFLNSPVDAIWFVEVAEHVEEQYLTNLLDSISLNLRYGGLLVFTFNEGPGHHHVTLKPFDWWEKRLNKSDLHVDLALTSTLRSCSTMKRDFIRSNGYIFRRC